MSQNLQEQLWETIRKNMGDNSFTTFKDMYQGETLEEQIKGVRELFTFAFGAKKTQELVLPLSEALTKGEK